MPSVSSSCGPSGITTMKSTMLVNCTEARTSRMIISLRRWWSSGASAWPLAGAGSRSSGVSSTIAPPVPGSKVDYPHSRGEATRPTRAQKAARSGPDRAAVAVGLRFREPLTYRVRWLPRRRGPPGRRPGGRSGRGTENRTRSPCRPCGRRPRCPDRRRARRRSRP